MLKNKQDERSPPLSFFYVVIGVQVRRQARLFLTRIKEEVNENFKNSRWRTAAILKIVISPYLGEKSSDFDEILYTAADFELDERNVIKNEKKLHWTDSESDRTYFLYKLYDHKSIRMTSGVNKIYKFNALRQR